MTNPALSEDFDNIYEGIVGETIIGIEAWCVEFNIFFTILFVYLKYIFVFILLSMGILTLLRLRGIYLQTRTGNKRVNEDDKGQLYKPRLILGFFYIMFAIGILFNFLTYFLIIALDPLPDRLIFNFINFAGYIDPYYMNRIEDLNAAQYPHEKTIYFVFAMGSFSSMLGLVLSVWYIINSNRLINNPKKALGGITGGLIGGILFGFTTFMPFFL